MRWYAFLMIFTVVLVWACNDADAPVESRINTKPYFDLKGYFEQQISQLKTSQPKAVKKVSIGAKTEEITTDTLDYAQELRIFTDSDINKPAWLDKYTIDSVKNTGGNLQAISYKANTDDLKVRLIEVNFSQDTITRIYIVNRLNTAVADADQELVFMPGKGYKLGARQKVAYADAKNIGVEVNWK